MNKVALVNPPTSIEENYGSMKDLAPDFPILGIAFLSSYVKKYGFDLDLLDLSTTSQKEAESILRRYDLIGFSAYVTNYRSIIELAGKLKANNNIIVVGGPHATLCAEDFNSSNIDFLVAGDGELPIMELLSALKEERNINSVSGLFRQNENFEFRVNSAGEMIDNLDLIGPPDIEKYDLGKYYPPVHIKGKKVIHTLTSRGCPHKCSFCAAAEVAGRRIRFRSVESIISEMLYYQRYGYDSIIFYDDIFTIRPKRVYELCKAIMKRKLDIKWACFTRTDCVNFDMLKIMKEAGCYLITYGCESINDKTLMVLKKGLTSRDNIKGVEMTAKAGILSNSSFMIGLPGESRDDILNTINFARNSDLTFAVFPIFEPFKGTPIYEVCKRTGSWQTIQGQYNQMLLDQSEVWVPDGMSRSDIVLLARKAFREFYFKPKRLARIISYILFDLPHERSLRFMKGGVSFFARHFNKSHSTHYTHY